MKRKILLWIFLTSALAGCASGRTREIAIGMLAGAVVGAAVGNQYVYHGQYGQLREQNTVATAAVFALATGAVLDWHYQSLQQQEVDISGRYARFRLCNPDELNPQLFQDGGSSSSATVMPLQSSQVGKLALSLDDNTKWRYPVFQRRDLMPERSDNQVVSQRYVWEIVRPGSFVTRSQNPDFFAEDVEKPK